MAATGLAAGCVTVGRAVYVVVGAAAGVDGEERGVYVVTPFWVLTADFSAGETGVDDDFAPGV